MEINKFDNTVKLTATINKLSYVTITLKELFEKFAKQIKERPGTGREVSCMSFSNPNFSDYSQVMTFKIQDIIDAYKFNIEDYNYNDYTIVGILNGYISFDTIDMYPNFVVYIIDDAIFASLSLSKTLEVNKK